GLYHSVHPTAFSSRQPVSMFNRGNIRAPSFYQDQLITDKSICTQFCNRILTNKFTGFFFYVEDHFHFFQSFEIDLLDRPNLHTGKPDIVPGFQTTYIFEGSGYMNGFGKTILLATHNKYS